MKRAVRVALSAALMIVAVGCTTQAPTPSPVGTASTASPVGTGPTASPSAQPTPPPTPTIGPTGETGFPSSVLGLDVHSVAGIHQLAAAGELDGRLAAVGGYWVQFAFPCPYMPHQAVLVGFCYGGRFADTPEAAQNSATPADPAPIAVPETANGNQLWSAGGVNGGATMVVLIVHAADSRAWQCAPADLASCHSRLVIDSVAWVNGDAMAINLDITALPSVSLTLDEVIAAGVKPGEQVVTAYPLLATDLNEVDPRLLGQGSGIVWFLRVRTGTPDGDAISDGVARLVSDSSPAIVAELPLVVADDYTPARVVLDTNGPVPDQLGQAHFQVTRGGSVIAKGVLASSLPPFAMEPGDYSLDAWGISGAILTSPRPGAQCSFDLSLTAGDDVAYYADWPGGADCTWKAGTLFP